VAAEVEVDQETELVIRRPEVEDHLGFEGSIDDRAGRRVNPSTLAVV
jgi:hypothetical protein